MNKPSHSSRHTMVIAVHLFLLHQNKVLLMRRFNTGFADGQFSVPAGHVEANEGVIRATIREAKEEATVTIAAKNLHLAHVMYRHTDRESIDFFFVCRKWKGEAIINEPEKCDDLRWVDVKKLPRNMVRYVREALRATLNEKAFSEKNF